MATAQTQAEHKAFAKSVVAGNAFHFSVTNTCVEATSPLQKACIRYTPSGVFNFTLSFVLGNTIVVVCSTTAPLLSNILKLQPTRPVKIIAVSKTFPLSHIKPLIDYGHDHFGENKVQECFSKWTEIKKVNHKLKLHMIGKLQSNKAKNAVEIFDYIHSLDNQKLADALKKNQKKINKNLKYFIQVNIGNEMQKSGIPVNELDSFYNYCTKEINLDVIGLMVLPPNEKKSKKYFEELYNLNNSLALNELSMGMSSDYLDAINQNSTFVRIGSLIFGSRN